MSTLKQMPTIVNKVVLFFRDNFMLYFDHFHGIPQLFGLLLKSSDESERLLSAFDMMNVFYM